MCCCCIFGLFYVDVYDCYIFVLLLMLVIVFFFFFFFSSRRRHTRLTCDWSSDVCSSDLLGGTPQPHRIILDLLFARAPVTPTDLACIAVGENGLDSRRNVASQQRRRRSEERRVGKECRSRWSPEQ